MNEVVVAVGGCAPGGVAEGEDGRIATWTESVLVVVGRG